MIINILENNWEGFLPAVFSLVFLGKKSVAAQGILDLFSIYGSLVIFEVHVPVFILWWSTMLFLHYFFLKPFTAPSQVFTTCNDKTFENEVESGENAANWLFLNFQYVFYSSKKTL